MIISSDIFWAACLDNVAFMLDCKWTKLSTGATPNHVYFTEQSESSVRRASPDLFVACTLSQQVVWACIPAVIQSLYHTTTRCGPAQRKAVARLTGALNYCIAALAPASTPDSITLHCAFHT